MPKTKPKSSKLFRVFIWISIPVLVIYMVILGNLDDGAHQKPPQVDYTQECNHLIKAHANNPSTVKINLIAGHSSKTQNSVTYITQEFSAKNSYGLKKNMVAYCTGKDGQITDIKIQERAY